MLLPGHPESSLNIRSARLPHWSLTNKDLKMSRTWNLQGQFLAASLRFTRAAVTHSWLDSHITLRHAHLCCGSFFRHDVTPAPSKASGDAGLSGCTSMLQTRSTAESKIRVNSRCCRFSSQPGRVFHDGVSQLSVSSAAPG